MGSRRVFYANARRIGKPPTLRNEPFRTTLLQLARYYCRGAPGAMAAVSVGSA
jgi:hypothetical protein